MEISFPLRQRGYAKCLQTRTLVSGIGESMSSLRACWLRISRLLGGTQPQGARVVAEEIRYVIRFLHRLTHLDAIWTLWRPELQKLKNQDRCSHRSHTLIEHLPKSSIHNLNFTLSKRVLPDKPPGKSFH